MTIVLENLTIPERGMFELDFKQSIEIKVTAEEARRKVSGIDWRLRRRRR